MAKSLSAAPSYPHWVMDDSPIDDPFGKGEEVVKFFNALRHPKSTHPEKRLGLPRFWERIFRRIYGPCREDGQRIVRSVFILMPRGARKTTYIGGGLGLYHTIGKAKTPNSQVLLGAGAEDQAEIALDEAIGMVKATPGLIYPDNPQRNKVKLRGQYIEHIEAGSELVVMSSDGDTGHGKTPAVSLFDELHVYRNRKLWAAMNTGLLKVPNSLRVVTTTAGKGQRGLAWEEYEYARKVATGEVVNEAYLPIIFEPPPGADWQDPNLWHLVNPGMREGFPDVDGFIAAVREAKEKPSDREDLKQYNLNFWLDHSVAPFVDMEVYDEGKEDVDLEWLKGKRCWLAVDMSTVNDLSVIVAAFPDEDDGFDLWAWFFCPQADLELRADKDKFDYPRWAKEGFITPTPGNAIDPGAIEKKIRELCDDFDVQEIGFDRAYGRNVMNPLQADNYPVVIIEQGWITQSPALNVLETTIVKRKLRHGGHPILRWCFENVNVKKDSAGNRTMHKGMSRDRIDGAVGSWMAVSRAEAGKNDVKPKSAWETTEDIESLFSDQDYAETAALFED